MTGAISAPLPELERRIRAAAARAFGDAHADVEPLVRRSDRADFQANLAMSLGKTLKRQPREVAQALLDALDVADLCERVELAGPGFINLTLKREYLERFLAQTLADPRLGVSAVEKPDTVVIDYASPNVAKEMHVGHLRSSIIGDALARLLEFLGHRVIRQNHLGDWGTPFGMLIEQMIDVGGTEQTATHSLGELNAFYRNARQKFDSDPGFAERARLRVVALQAGDPETLALWKTLVAHSIAIFGVIWQRLGLTLKESDVRGESFYNPYLPEIAADLEARSLAQLSDGALCAFVPGFQNREGEPLPLLVRKQDGGFGYPATDLAALRYRSFDLGGTRLLYVVGSPQQQHFQMVFAFGAIAGYLKPGARAEFVGFGSILGDDRKMLRSRSGETLRLSELLDEGEARALAALSERSADPADAARTELARVLALGAIKYADLSSDRIKDYVFDWKRMLTAEGNTGPYLQYAHARVRSIFRNLTPGETIAADAIRIEHEKEHALALVLASFNQAIRTVETTLEPHTLCGYLYELASAYTAFYVACPVLRAETPELRASRLALCDLTGRVLARGMGLLGIEAPERM